MARNKVATAARGESTRRRDGRRDDPRGDSALAGLASTAPGPCEQVAGREVLDRFRAALTAEERELADLRGRGYSWREVSEKLGGTGEARRMQLTRAVDRVARELGFEEAADA